MKPLSDAKMIEKLKELHQHLVSGNWDNQDCTRKNYVTTEMANEYCDMLKIIIKRYNSLKRNHIAFINNN
jgi:hypothetical protein